MYGAKIKKHLIIALITGLIGVIIIFLKIIKVIPSENIYTLLAVCFMLFGFAFYLRPKMLVLKNKTKYLLQYREGFYKELDETFKKNKNKYEIVFEQKNNIIYYNKFAFDNLNLNEFIDLSHDLLKDFVMIFYCKDEKTKEARIETLNAELILEDGKRYETKVIDNYKILI